MEKFYVTIGESVWNNRVLTREFGSFEEFRRMYAGRMYIGEKGGRYITSAVLDGNKRKYESLDYAEWMIFDIDSGQPLHEIAKALVDKDLYAFIWPTFSYGKTVSKVPMAKAGDPIKYLLEEKGYRPDILKTGFVVSDTPIEDDAGRQFITVTHKPMQKWRVLLFLSEPFSFAEDRNACIAEWKAFYNSVGIWLGFDYDKAGERAVQPMFLPCKPEGAHHPEPFEIEGIDLRFEDVPIVVVERTRETIRKQEASKKDWKGKQVPGLKKALALMPEDYDMVAFLGDHLDHRSGGDNRLYVRCPNEADHTCGDTLDMEVRNQGNGYRGWRIGCFHSCNDLPEFDGDRARYLEALMVEYDLTIDDLLDDAYLDNKKGGGKDMDQLIDELQELLK